MLVLNFFPWTAFLVLCPVFLKHDVSDCPDGQVRQVCGAERKAGPQFDALRCVAACSVGRRADEKPTKDSHL